MCPRCTSENVQEGSKHPTMPYRCRDCRKFFSVRTGTIMEASNLGYQTWALAIYILNTGIKGTSSMKLHCDLGITQKSAWYLAHRIREAWDDAPFEFDGPVEADETYIGGLEGNKHASKRSRPGGGTGGKTAVIGVKDRATNQISAAVIPNTQADVLLKFVEDRITDDTMVYTDDAYGYRDLMGLHESVTHSVGQYVDGMAHTNGIESFWAQLKRGYHGTYHQMSPKHLDRYVREFSGRHNSRPMDTIDQMARTVRGLVGKRLRYRDLVG